MEKVLLPSLLSADFYNLKEELHFLEEEGLSHLHLDVMDGHFVPNLSFGPGLISRLRPHTKLFFDCHLMVEDPEPLFPAFQKAGCDLLSIHVEAVKHPVRALQEIRGLGMQAGVVLNPGTHPESIRYLFDYLDLVLVMSVEPGFGGQSYLASATEKLAYVRQMIDQSKRPILLEVDGGINKKTVGLAKEAGADWFVAGSAVFSAKDRKKAVEFFRQALA